MDWPQIIGIALGSGGFGALAVKWWEHSRAKSGQDHNQYMDMYTRLQHRIDGLEKAHEECQDENAELREQIGSLRESVRILSGQITDCKVEIEQNRKRINEV